MAGHTVTRLVRNTRLLVSEDTLAELAQTISRDEFFLELAVDDEAQILVTGDKDLLALSPFRNI